MPLAAAVAGAAIIGGGASIISANKAAKAAKNAAAQNNALQTDIYNQNKETLAPYVAQGGAATPVISGLLGLGDAASASKAFDTFTGSDGYKFRLNEGNKAVQAALGSRGLLDSGAAQKALLKYGQGAASDEFGKYLGYLGQQQGVGLTAASAQAGVSQNYASAVGANNNNAANAVGNAALTVGNSINSVLNSGLSAYALNSGLKSSYGATTPTFLSDQALTSSLAARNGAWGQGWRASSGWGG